MQILLKNLSDKTSTYVVESSDLVENLKAKVADNEGISSEELRLLFAGHQLEDGHVLNDYGIHSEATLHMSLRLLGAGKKRKKKVYTTPKKVKHVRRKVKLATLKYYKVDDDGTITRLRTECSSVSCGGGVFMAKHKDRLTCGRCKQTLIENK